MTAASTYLDLDDPRFNREFVLPTCQAHQAGSPLRITYADYGYDGEDGNTFMFFGPLLGSRLLHVSQDYIAKKHKIRVLAVDRPGIGGTESVNLDCRMIVWREAIPALLSHLGIRHIAVGCHSGGTIYALDLLLHHPALLHPERPYLAIGAPWILPSHTDSTLLSIIQLLPAGIIGMSDKLQKLINNHIGPAIGMVFGVSAIAVSKLRPKTIPPVEQVGLHDPALPERNVYNETIERIYKEGIQGISQDSIVFMQKVDAINSWDTWSDYDTLVPLLSEALRAAERKLTIDVFYAENDSWIGNKESRGPRWFDQCWKTEGTDINYTSVLVKQADHNNVWDLSSGAVQRVFERISQISGLLPNVIEY